MREFLLDGHIKIKCKNDKDCLFCDHCSDIFWDYSNGPYMIICDLGEEPVNNTCRYFTEGDPN